MPLSDFAVGCPVAPLHDFLSAISFLFSAGIWSRSDATGPPSRVSIPEHLAAAEHGHRHLQLINVQVPEGSPLEDERKLPFVSEGEHPAGP